MSGNENANGNANNRLGWGAIASGVVMLIGYLFVPDDQKLIVIWLALGCVVLHVVLYALSQINEMVLRHKRFRHELETPMYQQTIMRYPRDQY